MVCDNECGVQADLWSLGVILFELYKGEPPFFTNSIYNLIQQILRDEVSYPPDMSPNLKSFLQVCRIQQALAASCLETKTLLQNPNQTV